MGMRKEGEASIERRLKRRLARFNLDMLKPQRTPDPRVKAHGGYKLRDAATGAIIFGETPYPFSKTLEEIEAWIDAREERAEN